MNTPDVYFYIIIGNILEKINKEYAMRFYYRVMQPYNPPILYERWHKLWKTTKIKRVVELGMIDLSTSKDGSYTDESLDLLKDENKTLDEYWDTK